jgi:hypothetical protein
VDEVFKNIMSNKRLPEYFTIWKACLSTVPAWLWQAPIAAEIEINGILGKNLPDMISVTRVVES